MNDPMHYDVKFLMMSSQTHVHMMNDLAKAGFYRIKTNDNGLYNIKCRFDTDKVYDLVGEIQKKYDIIIQSQVNPHYPSLWDKIWECLHK